jgi:hypothetical protein
MEAYVSRRILIVNYLITFTLVGWALYAVHSPEKVRKNWYEPEYTSHMSGTYGQLSCNDCHIQPFAAAETKTCWTAGCHSHFDPESPPAALLLLNKDEAGRNKPNWGAQLAFHLEASEKMSCEACHPSHRLPTRAAFNKSTIQQAMKDAGLPPLTKATVNEHRVKKLEIFHAGARKFTQDVNNCATCHVAPQNPIHINAAAQSCNTCHGNVTSWKTGQLANNRLGSLFEGHPIPPQATQPGDPVLQKWVAGYQPRP